MYRRTFHNFKHRVVVVVDVYEYWCGYFAFYSFSYSINSATGKNKFNYANMVCNESCACKTTGRWWICIVRPIRIKVTFSLFDCFWPFFSICLPCNCLCRRKKNSSTSIRWKTQIDNEEYKLYKEADFLFTKCFYVVEWKNVCICKREIDFSGWISSIDSLCVYMFTWISGTNLSLSLSHS